MTNTQIVIAELPSDSLTAEHFRQTTTDMPVAGDGQVLLKVILMSIDAANRSWMKGATVWPWAISSRPRRLGRPLSLLMRGNARNCPKCRNCRT